MVAGGILQPVGGIRGADWLWSLRLALELEIDCVIRADRRCLKEVAGNRFFSGLRFRSPWAEFHLSHSVERGVTDQMAVRIMVKRLPMGAATEPGNRCKVH